MDGIADMGGTQGCGFTHPQAVDEPVFSAACDGGRSRDRAAMNMLMDRQWLGALHDVLASRRGVQDQDVTRRARALAQRPAGHDHTQ